MTAVASRGHPLTPVLWMLGILGVWRIIAPAATRTAHTIASVDPGHATLVALAVVAVALAIHGGPR